jgi:hypothetical protein
MPGNFSLLTVAEALLLLAGHSAALQATPYHVSPSGSDNLDGTTIGTAFATINKAATVMQAGDTCLIQAGTYRETITPTQSGTASTPIVFQAFGDGEVVVSGADQIPGTWTIHSGSVYKTTVTLASAYSDRMTSNTTLLANQVFAAGHMMTQARWPNNAGTNAADPAFDTTRSLPPAAAGSFQGAICWESSWFVSRTGVVQNADATSIQFAKTLCVQHDELRRWFCGALGLLDREGEWHYDASTTTLYLWAPGGSAPVNVEVKKRNFAFDLRGRSWITVRGISLFAATVITDASSRHVLLDRISAKYVSHHATIPVLRPPNSDGCNEVAMHTDDTGIMLYGDSSAIVNSSIEGSSGNGVLTAGRGNVVFNCLIKDCDYMGTYAAAVHVLQDPVYVLHNTIAGMGRDGVCWEWHRADGGMNGDLFGSVFAYNHIHDFGRLQADVAGIYICCGIDMTGSSFHHNRVHDCKAPYWCEGIYFDNGSTSACTYDNTSVRYNLGGTPGACPSDTSRAWVAAAGCNFAGCGESEGTQLPQYDFVPWVPARVQRGAGRVAARAPGVVTVGHGAIVAAAPAGSRIDLYNMRGALRASARGSGVTPITLGKAGQGKGMYVVRIVSAGQLSASTVVVGK